MNTTYNSEKTSNEGTECNIGSKTMLVRVFPHPDVLLMNIDYTFSNLIVKG